MIIRPYKPDDRTAVLELLKLNTPDYFAPSEKVDLEKYLDLEIEDYFVIEENFEIIGAGGINYFPEDKTARISWDIIKPNAQGKGIGTRLTEYRIKLLHKHNGIDLIVVRTTQLVYKFYERLGFNLIEIEKNYWAKGYDLYQMELRTNSDN